MPTRYVPILRWKQGERIALGHLSAAGRKDVAPHFVIAQAQFGGPTKKASTKPPKKAPLSASDYCAKQLNDSWGKARFYVDASDLSGTSAAHQLDDLRASANSLGLELVPSTRLGAPTEYGAAVLRAIQADGRGVCLRISLTQLTTASGWVGKWGVPLSDTDLIIDLAGGVASVLALGQSVQQAFQSLHKAASWRSVTMAGGSIPANLSGYSRGLTMLPRAELQLWQTLQTASMPFALNFGDYTIIGPEATTDDIDYPVPINAKYTCPAEFAVFHGVKIKGPGSVARDLQYRSYANQIIKLPTRNALAHCWGDQMIDAIAASSTSRPGSPASWVSYGVNRHIELTRSQLP